MLKVSTLHGFYNFIGLYDGFRVPGFSPASLQRGGQAHVVDGS